MNDAPRNCLTAEEFLAEVEAYRRMRLQNPLKTSRPFVPGRFVRTYILNPPQKFIPRKKSVSRTEATP